MKQIQLAPYLYSPVSFGMMLRGFSVERLKEAAPDIKALPPEYRAVYEAECQYRTWSFSRGGGFV